MRSVNHQLMMNLVFHADSPLKADDPFVAAARESKEGRMISADRLQSRLEASGFKFDYPEGRKHTVQCNVTKEGVLVASGTAGNKEEAVLHGLLGYLKERALARA